MDLNEDDLFITIGRQLVTIQALQRRVQELEQEYSTLRADIAREKASNEEA